MFIIKGDLLIDWTYSGFNGFSLRRDSCFCKLFWIMTYFRDFAEVEFPERRKLKFIDKVPNYSSGIRPPKMQRRLILSRGPELIHNKFAHEQYGIVVRPYPRGNWINCFWFLISITGYLPDFPILICRPRDLGVYVMDTLRWFVLPWVGKLTRRGCLPSGASILPGSLSLERFPFCHNSRSLTLIN